MGSKEIFSEAEKRFRYGDSLAVITLPTVKNLRTYMNILRSCHEAIYGAMRSYLVFQREKKRIGYVPDSFELIEEVFLNNFALSIGMSLSEINLSSDLKKIHNGVQKEHYETEDKEVFILGGGVTLDSKKVKEILSRCRRFIEIVGNSLV